MEKLTEEQRMARRKSASAYIDAEEARKKAFNLPSEMTEEKVCSLVPESAQDHCFWLRTQTAAE